YAPRALSAWAYPTPDRGRHTGSSGTALLTRQILAEPIEQSLPSPRVLERGLARTEVFVPNDDARAAVDWREQRRDLGCAPSAYWVVEVVAAGLNNPGGRHFDELAARGQCRPVWKASDEAPGAACAHVGLPRIRRIHAGRAPPA